MHTLATHFLDFEATINARMLVVAYPRLREASKIPCPMLVEQIEINIESPSE